MKLTRRTRLLLLVLALLLGAALAYTLLPLWREREMLHDMVHIDHSARERAWQWLLSEPAPGQPRRIESRMGKVAAALRGSSGELMLEATDRLRAEGLWDWDLLPHDLLLHEIRLRLDGDEADQLLAAQQVWTFPLNGPAEQAMPMFDLLLRSPNALVRKTGFEAACAWLGRERASELLSLETADDERLARLTLMALNWSEREIVEPDEAPKPVGWAQEALAGPVTDANGAVYAAALLAERAMPRSVATELAAGWLVNFDDDRKRAGALLAALLNQHVDLVAEVLEASTDGRVRTTLRLALHAMGQPYGDEDPREFAHRAMMLESGDFNPDTVLCLLIAGHTDAAQWLVSQPQLSEESLRQRAALIERFFPEWHALAGVPGGNGASVRRHFQEMHVLWLLTQRRLTFDASDRTYR